MGQLIVPERRLTAAGQRWGANEIVAQVGLQGTWRARLYRRHGTVEETGTSEYRPVAEGDA